MGKSVKKVGGTLKKGSVTFIVLTSVMALLLIAVLVGTYIADLCSAAINSYFGLSSYEKVETGDEVKDTEYFKSAYKNDKGEADKTKLRNDAVAKAKEVEGEGIVLVWNDDNSLPLSSSERKVSLFGRCSAHLVYSGFGSGGQLNKRYGADSLKTELEEDGFSVNSSLWSFYSDKGTDFTYTSSGADRIVNEVDLAAYTDTSSYTEYGDAAIIVLGRYGGEQQDLYLSGTTTVDGDNLSLSSTEIDMLRRVTSAGFDKVILLLNSAYPFNFKQINEFRDKIDSCLWIGNPSTYGLDAVGDVLKGEIVPSGRLVDTFLYDNKSAPATVNYGDFTYGDSSNKGQTYTLDATDVHYQVYQENIYIGYRYFETRYEDKVIKRTGVGDYDYSSTVYYPFGHGLSYTQFTYSDMEVKVNKEGDYEVSVTVTNAGSEYAAKEVVEVYIQKPYTDYDVTWGIEKASVELCGFEKTGLIEPGKSERVTVTVKNEAFRTYDANGQLTYILEKGDYYLAVGKNAHDALNNILASKGKNTNDGMDYNGNADFAYLRKVDRNDFSVFATAVTGNPITDRFDHADWNVYEGSVGQEILYLSRYNWELTYPKSAPELKMTEQLRKDLQYDREVVEDPDAKMPTYGAQNGLTLIMLMDEDFDSPVWDDLLDQTTYEEQALLCSDGYHHTHGMASVAKPETLDNNGPMGFKGAGIQYPCEPIMASTWNKTLMREMGELMGEEMLVNGKTGIYGPASNIHRTAYAGRNYEYFSEDPYLSAQIATYETLGIQSKGCYVQIKHFIMNDQDWNRRGVQQWSTEQAIREIYLAAFEDVITVGHAHSVMSSFTRMGPKWCGADYNLLTNVLRGEWGFDGFVNSDCPDGGYMSLIDGIQAGNDTWDNNHNGSEYNPIKNSPTAMQCLRLATKRILYTTLHSNAMNGTSNTTKIVQVRNWWQDAIVAVDVCVGVLFGVSAGLMVFMILKDVKRKKEENER